MRMGALRVGSHAGCSERRARAAERRTDPPQYVRAAASGSGAGRRIRAGELDDRGRLVHDGALHAASGRSDASSVAASRTAVVVRWARQTLRIRRRDRDRAGRARRDLPESMDAVDRVKVRSGKGLLTIGRRLFPGPCLLKPPWTPCRFPVGIGRLSGSVGNRASGSVAGCPMTRRFEAGSPPVFRRSFHVR